MQKLSSLFFVFIVLSSHYSHALVLYPIELVPGDVKKVGCPLKTNAQGFSASNVTEADLKKVDLGDHSENGIYISSANSGQFLLAALYGIPQESSRSANFEISGKPIHLNSENISTLLSTLGLDQSGTSPSACLTESFLEKIGIQQNSTTDIYQVKKGFDYYYGEFFYNESIGTLLIIVDLKESLIYTYSRFS